MINVVIMIQSFSTPARYILPFQVSATYAGAACRRMHIATVLPLPPMSIAQRLPGQWPDGVLEALPILRPQDGIIRCGMSTQITWLAVTYKSANCVTNQSTCQSVQPLPVRSAIDIVCTRSFALTNMSITSRRCPFALN